jgi:hypothetical protein
VGGFGEHTAEVQRQWMGTRMLDERPCGLGAVVNAGMKGVWYGEESQQFASVGTVIGVAECDERDGG